MNHSALPENESGSEQAGERRRVPNSLTYHRRDGRRHLAATCMWEDGCAIEPPADTQGGDA